MWETNHTRGITLDPRNLARLLAMPKPSTAANLDQFYGAVNWIRAGIPDFPALTTPIQAFLTTQKWQLGNRKPQLAKVILTPELWTPERQTCFDQVKRVIASRVKLTHLDFKQRLFLHTDASDLYYAAVLTQVLLEDLEKTQAEQRQAPLAFVSDAFKGAMLNWSPFEKEAFAIIYTTARLHYFSVLNHTHLHRS